MIKKFKNIVTSIAMLGMMLTPALAPVAVHAQDAIQPGLCAGADLNTQGGCDPGAQQEAENTVNTLLTTVINIFSLIVGVVSVIMIIIGGLKYITSGGDAGNVTGAKNTILYAIVGLVIVALAQVIVRFVLAKVGSA
jgi:hypothetical protein